MIKYVVIAPIICENHDFIKSRPKVGLNNSLYPVLTPYNKAVSIFKNSKALNSTFMWRSWSDNISTCEVMDSVSVTSYRLTFSSWCLTCLCNSWSSVLHMNVSKYSFGLSVCNKKLMKNLFQFWAKCVVTYSYLIFYQRTDNSNNYQNNSYINCTNIIINIQMFLPRINS